jgi:hypothetical protein
VRKQTLVLFLMAIALAVALYFLFGLFLGPNSPDYANAIAAAFMGALVTVVITMVLLNRQSEAELLKERNVEVLRKKIEIYDGLTDRLQAMSWSCVAATALFAAGRSLNNCLPLRPASRVFL